MKTTDERGRYLTNEQLDPTAKARAVKSAKARARKRTEKEFLAAVVETIDTNDIQAMVKQIMVEAMGNGANARDARNWLGRFIFGGGKISLQDVANPPVIRKS